jgi:hypothetical protein
MALQLADDRRRRVRAELDLAVDVEAVDGFQQSDAGDLHQVLDRLAATAEAAHEVLDERIVDPHELLARGLCFGAAGAQLLEELAHSFPVDGTRGLFGHGVM